MNDIMNRGRDDHGRFRKGNSFGRGRPRKEIERDYLTAMRDTCSRADIQEIFGKLVEQAKTGDLRAAKFVMDALVGSREPLALTRIEVEDQLGIDPVDAEVQRQEADHHLREVGSLTQEQTGIQESPRVPIDDETPAPA